MPYGGKRGARTLGEGRRGNAVQNGGNGKTDTKIILSEPHYRLDPYLGGTECLPVLRKEAPQSPKLGSPELQRQLRRPVLGRRKGTPIPDLRSKGER